MKSQNVDKIDTWSEDDSLSWASNVTGSLEAVCSVFKKVSTSFILKTSVNREL